MISHRICFTLTKKIVGKSLEVTPDYINVDGFVIPRSQALAILNNSVVIYQDKVILDKEVSGTCDDKFGFSYVLESGSTITPLSNSFLEMVSVTVPDTQETVEVAEVEEGKDTPAPIVEAAPKKRGRKPKATTASQVVEEAPAKEEVPEFVEEDQEDDELENLKVEDDESEEGEDEVIEDIELEEEDSDEEELAEEPEEPEEDEVDADAEESSELEEFEDGEDEDTEDSSEDEDELEDEIFQLDDE